MKPVDQDKALASVGQEQVRQLVSQLPEDTLSMAWRSSLNEKLLEASAANARRKRRAWMFRPAFGLAVAGALAAIAFIQPSFRNGSPSVSHSTGTLEAALVMDHQTNVELSDLSGAGLNPAEASPSQNISTDGEWSDIDLDSL